MRSPGAVRAFSLLEVIIAVALFATTVTIILALLPALTKQGAVAADTLTAQRLPDAVKVELARLAAPDLEALAAQIPIMANPPAPGLALVSTRDATQLHSLAYRPPVGGRIAEAAQYFLIECWRFPDEPLRFTAQKSFLALAVRVSSPYRLPGLAAPVAEAERSELTFTVVLNR